MYRDLREYIDEVEKMGELVRIQGADWNLEAGGIGEMTSDAVLLDSFPGYPKGYRMFFNVFNSLQRWLLMQGWDTNLRGNDLARAWHDRLQSFSPVPPQVVDGGPVLENVQEGDDIDLLKFPVPWIHPKDGGRYIGSADAVIMVDPDTGRANFGTYRVQVINKSTLSPYISTGKDGTFIVKKYQAMNKPCPVVVVPGLDPAMFYASAERFAYNCSEYEIAGWLKGSPIEVIMGKYTGIPIPARAEVAIEGEILPNELVVEGPFGEWTGYGEARKSWVMQVKRVMHRNDPILTVSSPGVTARPPEHLTANPRISGILWDQMEKAGVRGITGVAMYLNRLLIVVSLRNLYAGHVRQAGHIATQCHAGAYLGRYAIVVDDGVDPYNIEQVMWAVAKWSDPARAIDIVNYCWSDRMDCGLYYDETKSDAPDAPIYNSRAVIDACRPYEWAPDYKENVVLPTELVEKIKATWGHILFKPGRKLETKVWGH